MWKFAFAGFRHGHVNALYKLAKDNPRVEIAAAWEADEKARRQAEENLGVKFTHDDYNDAISSEDIDVVVIGDYYGIQAPMQ